jgi:hypothetical protein
MIAEETVRYSNVARPKLFIARHRCRLTLRSSEAVAEVTAYDLAMGGGKERDPEDRELRARTSEIARCADFRVSLPSDT